MRHGESFKWYHYLPLRDKIDERTGPINADYLLVFGSGESKLSLEPTDTGYCDFQSRRCWVNCESANVPLDGFRPWQKAFVATEQDQYVMTMRIAAHERAHARWTDYHIEDFELRVSGGETVPHPSRKGVIGAKQYDRLLHFVFNTLEDERIERLIERDFRYLRGYMRLGSKMRLKGMPIEDFHYMGQLGGNKIPLDPNDPSLIIAWVLKRRHLVRAGIKESCPLSEYNQGLLVKIEPLLKQAFMAKGSHEVVELSRQIIAILEIREYNQMMQRLAREMSQLAGRRRSNDSAKGRSKKESDAGGTVDRGDQGEGEGQGQQSSKAGDSGKAEGPGKGKDGEEEGNGPIKRQGKQQQPQEGPGQKHGPGTQTKGGPQEGQSGQGQDKDSEDEESDGEGGAGQASAGGWNEDPKEAEKSTGDAVDRDFVATGYQNAQGSMKKRRRVHAAGPYEEIFASIRPYLNACSSLFRMERTKPGIDHDRNGSRLDMKRAMRGNIEPFKIPAPPSKSGKLSIAIVIDESGSMSGKKEWEAKRVAMMFFEALRLQHNVRVVVAPSGEIIAASEDGEIGKAYIAGYDSSSGTNFGDVLGRELTELGKEKNSKVRYAILIADGESDKADGSACKKAVDLFRRRGIRCLGVGLCLTSYGNTFFEGIFGDYYLSIDDAGELLPHMSKVLRTLATRAKEGRPVLG